MAALVVPESPEELFASRCLERLAVLRQAQQRFAFEHQAAVLELQHELTHFASTHGNDTRMAVSSQQHETAEIALNRVVGGLGGSSLSLMDAAEAAGMGIRRPLPASVAEVHLLPALVDHAADVALLPASRIDDASVRSLAQESGAAAAPADVGDNYRTRPTSPSPIISTMPEPALRWQNDAKIAKQRHHLPQRAFVVNVQRLCEMHENMDLLHEFVKSTAIAALTLVSAATVLQLQNTIIFISCIVIIFASHNEGHDRLTIDDFSSTIHLHPPSPVDNQNQILKSMSEGRSLFQRISGFCVVLMQISMITFLWFLCFTHWRHKDDAGTMELKDRFPWMERVVKEDSDFDQLALQLVVYTIMYLLYITFDIIQAYETQMVMPCDPDGGIWDVRKRGVPLRFRAFGLPSMWFTSAESKSDLLTWVNKLHPGIETSIVYPEELALYALYGDDSSREELACTLKEARYFDSDTNTVDSERSLDLDLCFFINNMRSPGMPFMGDFSYVAYAEEEGGAGGRINTNLHMVSTENPTE